MEHIPLEIKNIIEYIPFVIILVIILVAVLTWDILLDKIHYFVTLIGVFLWAIYLYIGSNSSKVSEWKRDQPADDDDDEHDEKNERYFIQPPINDDQFDEPSVIITCLFIVILLVGGLTLGIISHTHFSSSNNIDKGNTLKGFGVLFLIISIIGILFAILKLVNYNLFDIFGIGGADDNDTSNTSSTNNNLFIDNNLKWITPLSIIGLIIGIYMTVTGININKNHVNGETIDDSKIIKWSPQKFALSIGLIIQIVAFFGIIWLMYRFNQLTPENDDADDDDGLSVLQSIVLRIIFCLTLFLTGILCWAKSQQWPGIGKTTVGKDTPEANENVNRVEKGGFLNYEISNIKLFSLTESHKLIRPYYVSKLNAIKKGFQDIEAIFTYFE